MAGESGFLVEEFINSITTQLDRVQDALRIKAVNRPLTYALKDLSLELKVFAEMDGNGQVRFRTAGPNEAGASVVNLNFTTITKPMIEENTISLASSRSASLEELGLKPDERRRLEQMGVRNLAQLDRLQGSAGIKTVERLADISADRLRQAISAGRPRVTGPAPAKPPVRTLPPAPPVKAPPVKVPPPVRTPPVAHPSPPILRPGPVRAAPIKLSSGVRRVQLLGQGLLNYEDAPSVTLNGQPLALSELDHDRLSVDLPEDAQSGALAVNMPGGETVTFALDLDDESADWPPANGHSQAAAESDYWSPEGERQ